MESSANLNYITNLSVEESSGGWSGMNHHVYRQLKKGRSINVVQLVNPPYSFFDKAFSKLKRSVGFPGVFPAFTRSRLSRIAEYIEPRVNSNAELNFFHGSTSWIEYRSRLPYAMYLDACFGSYIDIYHDKAEFDSQQLHEVYRKETAFLEGATAVFFSSQWALDDAKKRYGLEGNNFSVAGLGGHLPGNFSGAEEIETQRPYFLFVSLDFVGKGGDLVIGAFTKLQDQFPDHVLKIVGQEPPETLYKNNPSIQYLGFIDKKIPQQVQQLTKLFSGAVSFLLPTSKDITPLVLIEAASVGCPAITIRRFGIPEIVKHMETGILLDAGNSLQRDLLDAMSLLCRDSQLRKRLGKNAITHVSQNFTWDRTGDIISEALNKLNHGYEPA